MEEKNNKHFQKIYNDYIDYGIVREFEIKDSARKRTDLCIWYWNDIVYLSSGMEFLCNLQDVIDECEDSSLPLFIYETSDTDKMNRILYVCDNSDYLEKLERLLSLTKKEKSFSLQLVDNR